MFQSNRRIMGTKPESRSGGGESGPIREPTPLYQGLTCPTPPIRMELLLPGCLSESSPGTGFGFEIALPGNMGPVGPRNDGGCPGRPRGFIPIVFRIRLS